MTDEMGSTLLTDAMRVTPADEDDATAGGTRFARLTSPTRLQTTQLVFWITFLMSVTCALVRQRDVFSKAHYPWGDAALNTLLVIRAEHFQQLEGNYSRVGFQHPGPFLLYMLAAGEAVFKYLLHVVPTPYNGQIVGVTVYVAVFLALTMVCLFRMTSSRGAVAIAFGLAFAFAARQGMFGDEWFPFLYMSAFLLFAVTAAAVAAGLTSELPLFVLSSGVLVHGHVSFLMFVAVTAVVVAAGWWARHRRAVRGEVSAHRKGMLASAILLAIFLLPMVLEVVLHYPGQWHRYWLYSLHGERAPRSMAQVVHFVGRYWSLIGFAPVVFALAGLAAVLLTASERDAGRRRIFLWLYGMLLLQTLLTGYYVLRGVDRLAPFSGYGYVAAFYEIVPLLLLVAAAAQLWIRIRERAAHRLPTLVRTAVAGAICVALLGAGTADARLGRFGTGPGNAVYPAIATALRDNPGRAGRTIGMIQDQDGVWAAASGLAVQMQRSDVPWCLDDASAVMTVLYTPSYVCHSDGPRWTIHVGQGQPVSTAHIVWTGWIGSNERRMHIWLYVRGK